MAQLLGSLPRARQQERESKRERLNCQREGGSRERA